MSAAGRRRSQLRTDGRIAGRTAASGVMLRIFLSCEPNGGPWWGLDRLDRRKGSTSGRARLVGTVHNSGRMDGLPVVRRPGGVMLRVFLSCERNGGRGGVSTGSTSGGGRGRVSTGSTSGRAGRPRRGLDRLDRRRGLDRLDRREGGVSTGSTCGRRGSGDGRGPRREAALGSLLGLNLRVDLALSAIGTKDRPHHEPEDEPDQNGGRHGEGRVGPEVFKHRNRIRDVAGWPARGSADATISRP